MIQINVYKNGYEIIGHAYPKICSEVSLWDWIASGMIIGLDDEARRYTSHNDNPNNPHEGLSWVVCNPQKGNLEWILEDFVISAARWRETYWGEQVHIKHIDELLIKP